MKIILTSIFVSDQQKALDFYTGVLGFIKKTEIPMGEYKWLTVVSPEGLSDIELLLEPMAFAPSKIYQQALFDAGIPLASFGVDDIQKEYDRLEKMGVVFRMKPTHMGPVTIARFEDTVGNIIQVAQK